MLLFVAECLLHHIDELPTITLLDKVECAVLQCCHRHGNVAVTGHHDEGKAALVNELFA